jgi:hypothetical protein
MLLDSKEIYIEKTKKDGKRTKLNLKCLNCNETFNTTTIHGLANQGCLGCNCSNFKSEKCLGEILKEIFPGFDFIKIRPD